MESIRVVVKSPGLLGMLYRSGGYGVNTLPRPSFLGMHRKRFVIVRVHQIFEEAVVNLRGTRRHVPFPRQRCKGKQQAVARKPFVVAKASVTANIAPVSEFVNWQCLFAPLIVFHGPRKERDVKYYLKPF